MEPVIIGNIPTIPHQFPKYQPAPKITIPAPIPIFCSVFPTLHFIVFHLIDILRAGGEKKYSCINLIIKLEGKSISERVGETKAKEVFTRTEETFHQALIQTATTAYIILQQTNATLKTPESFL